MTEQKEIGISEKMDLRLKELVSDGLFNREMDGYRLAVCIAIHKKLDFKNRILANKKTKYHTGTIDQGSILKNVIGEIYPSEKDNAYKALEQLADAGIEYLSSYFENNNNLDLDLLLKDDT